MSMMQRKQVANVPETLDFRPWYVQHFNHLLAAATILGFTLICMDVFYSRFKEADVATQDASTDVADRGNARSDQDQQAEMLADEMAEYVFDWSASNDGDSMSEDDLKTALFKVAALQNAGADANRQYNEAFVSGTLSDADVFVNYYSRIAENERPALMPYVHYVRHVRGGRFILAGKGLLSEASEFEPDFHHFMPVADHYNPAVGTLLLQSASVSMDDIVTANMLLDDPNLSVLAQDRSALIEIIKGRVGAKVQRNDQMRVDFMDDLDQYPLLDLAKVYLLQKNLVENHQLRMVLLDTIALDLSEQYKDTELGGAVAIDTRSGDVFFGFSEPVQDGSTNDNNHYFAKDPQTLAEQATFARYHLHAPELKTPHWAGPSGYTGDVSHSCHNEYYSGIVITSLAAGVFNVHYYRAIPAAFDANDPTSKLKALSFNLGEFTASGPVTR